MDLINPELPPFHILVRFGKQIPDELQGPALMAMEQVFRELGVPAEVFLETMRDQNVLRRKLTPKDMV